MQRQVIARLLRDIEADLADATALGELLQSQFEAALRHDSAALSALGEQIVARVDAMDARRDVRIKLVDHLQGRPHARSVEALADTLPQPAQQALKQAWSALATRVRECQRLNQRNGALIAEQHALMNRVLHGEEHTYVAA